MDILHDNDNAYYMVMRILKSLLDCCYTTIACVNEMHHNSFRKEVVVAIGVVLCHHSKPYLKSFMNSSGHITTFLTIHS